MIALIRIQGHRGWPVAQTLSINKTAGTMTDHPHDRRRPLGRFIGDIVTPDLPPTAEAFIQRAVQRLYLRRWLLMLSICVVLIFVGLYQLALVPALFGVLSIMVGGAFFPREGVMRPLRLNLRTGHRQTTNETVTGLLEGLPSAVILLDAQRRIVHFNNLATDFWPAMRQGDHISSYIRDPGVLEAVANAHATMRPRQMVPFEQRVPIERHLEARISWIGRPPSREMPQAAAIMIHLRDLTERERIDRLRTDFVSNASHELRTPLASLIGFIETLQGAARHDDKAREHFLDIMERQARRMARLIDNLLSLSRIEMRMHLRPQSRVNLIEIAEQVEADIEPIAEQANIAFHFDAASGPAWVLGDRDELIQILSNLVENAIKYGRDGGNVWLSVEREVTAPTGSKIMLRVRDDGVGIAEEHLPRLTERFYRASDNGGERAGTGLGLAIVKHVVTRHRGELRIESQPGRGSTFMIIIGEAPALPQPALAE